LRWSWHEPLGTDDIGRSTLSRLIYGARQSLLIGISTVSLTLVVGLMLGMTAGYLRGRFDAVINVVLDALLAIPALVLLVAVSSVGRGDLPSLIIALSVVGVPYFARLSRAHSVRLSQREYILAARSMGAGHLRILTRELLPNVLLPVLSFAFLFLAVVMV